MRSGETLHKGKGERITCIRSGLDGGPFVFEFELAPGAGGPPVHSHDGHDEIFEVLSGEIDITVGRTVRRCKAGDRLTLTPRDPHTFRNPSRTAPVVCRVEHGVRFERAVMQPDLARLALFIHAHDPGSVRVHNPVIRVLMGLIARVAALLGITPVLVDGPASRVAASSRTT